MFRSQTSDHHQGSITVLVQLLLIGVHASSYSGMWPYVVCASVHMMYLSVWCLVMYCLIDECQHMFFSPLPIFFNIKEAVTNFKIYKQWLRSWTWTVYARYCWKYAPVALMKWDSPNARHYCCNPSGTVAMPQPPSPRCVFSPADHQQKGSEILLNADTLQWALKMKTKTEKFSNDESANYAWSLWHYWVN